LELSCSIPWCLYSSLPPLRVCRLAHFPDHGLGRLVEFRFKGPPGTPPSYITTHNIGTT
jgi:hypothetical protein